MHFFIGSYTHMLTPTFGGRGDGIYVVHIDEQGTVELVHTVPTENPAYLAISDDNRFLYTITEKEQDAVVKAFTIHADFSLSFLNQELIPGSLPCHLVYCNGHIVVACYGSGNVLHYQTQADGKIMPHASHHIHTGKGVNASRQEAPHAHQAVLHPDQKTLFVPDLGIDTVKVYELGSSYLQPKPDLDITTVAGGGVRHLVFNKAGTLGYLSHELTGQVSVLEQQNLNWEVVELHESLPASYAGTPIASAIRLHPNERFLYAANRGYDGITVFEVQANSLQLKHHFKTHGEELREFNITPDGRFLIACHQISDQIMTFKIQEDGSCELISQTDSLISPVCVCFLK
ncbi:hypothetical protein FFWV33_16945 [Flavobacterium faecale]|uniref:6-phosphogluconolactonase n=1 Tax=Flavobacterium faecale TaxID=1355330 RepID=A0A2S1LH24_9FLAO|nr:lactonase family protein [Flavobacterium faecale]AWG23092.1 hypothetical protein FFWV33_16945 [Flavobacterium faecale]